MGWQDRDYNQSNFQRRGLTNPLWNILFGSVPLGTWFGIRVRVHASLIILVILQIIFARTKSGMGVENAVTGAVVLFGIVLLHEFGHCAAARWVGGEADDILLWPLGGLAFINTPQRPWPRFVGVAGGPLVNVIICLATGAGIVGLTGFLPPLNPLIPFGALNQEQLPAFSLSVVYYLWWIYATSWMLLLFNLLPIFPFDGGQILQTILWPKFGYYRSMNFACITGMIGCILLGIVGVVGFNLMLILLAGMSFIYCYQTRMALRAAGYDELADADEAIDYSASLHPDSPIRKKVKRRWFKAARKKAAREQAEQAQIDAILAKVHQHGLHSLSWWEKRTLRKATERQREHDLAERR